MGNILAGRPDVRLHSSHVHPGIDGTLDYNTYMTSISLDDKFNTLFVCYWLFYRT